VTRKLESNGWEEEEEEDASGAEVDSKRACIKKNGRDLVVDLKAHREIEGLSRNGVAIVLAIFVVEDVVRLVDYRTGKIGLTGAS
jgi:hypothetical protein